MNNRGWKTLARALVLTHTGMRASQLKRLEVDIDIRPHLGGDRPFVQVPAGKGGKAYELPLTSNGKAAFLLFLRVGAAGTFSTQAFHKSWTLACDQAHVARFNPYKLRHSFATMLRREGADLADVQALLGHKKSEDHRAVCGRVEGEVGRGCSAVRAWLERIARRPSLSQEDDCRQVTAESSLP